MLHLEQVFGGIHHGRRIGLDAVVDQRPFAHQHEVEVERQMGLAEHLDDRPGSGVGLLQTGQHSGPLLAELGGTGETDNQLVIIERLVVGLILHPVGQHAHELPQHQPASDQPHSAGQRAAQHAVGQPRPERTQSRQVVGLLTRFVQNGH